MKTEPWLYTPLSPLHQQAQFPPNCKTNFRFSIVLFLILTLNKTSLFLLINYSNIKHIGTGYKVLILTNNSYILVWLCSLVWLWKYRKVLWRIIFRKAYITNYRTFHEKWSKTMRMETVEKWNNILRKCIAKQTIGENVIKRNGELYL